jgi:hypothetical protein
MRFLMIATATFSFVVTTAPACAHSKKAKTPFPASGIWSTNTADCGDLRAYETKNGRQANGVVMGGLQGVEGAYAHVRRGELAWIESSCHIGKTRKGARPLKCAGEGLYWKASMRMVSPTRLQLKGEHPSNGPYYFCRA